MNRLVPIIALLSAPAFAQDPAPIPTRLVDAFPAQDKFDRPLYLDHHAADADRYWVVEQTGRIFRIPRDGAKGDRQLVIDWSGTCLHPNNGGHNEEGLLGFAFDPEWGSANHHVFLYYSHRRGGDGRELERESVISRFETRREGDAITIDPDSEAVVLRVDQPWGNHNGGTILFGPDRMLYVALGDGGAADDRGANGQNLGTLLAAILRIDVRGATTDAPYRVPADNPFVGREGARGEIWAYGLRNPWRMSFDRATGELWCADVGQNTWEEVDRVVAGGNYGWPIMEGTHDFPAGAVRTDDEKAGLVRPVAEYKHDKGVSVTGGFVYRGAAIPALRGRFVYGDFAFMTLWAVREDRDGGAHEVVELGKAPSLVAAFAEEPDGELLAVCFDGRIYRIVPGEAR